MPKSLTLSLLLLIMIIVAATAMTVSIQDRAQCISCSETMLFLMRWKFYGVSFGVMFGIFGLARAITKA